jgi:hypothetical protein
MRLADITNQMFTASSNLSPGSPESQGLQMRIAALQAFDKSLELLLRRVDTQRDAVQTEIEAVRKVIGKNIEQTFKTFA